ncbi:MAG: glycine zipper 2TM domain-containing protein [Sphingobacteriales bacterium]|nr:MAG: glycine zipper 2TM domain-containing protein [Sphingobacteriales bacterium]
MKKIFSAIGIILVSAVVFTACKNNATKPNDETKILSAADAAQYNEFQQFQEWKKQQDMQNDRMAGTTASNTGATRVVYRTKPVYRTSAPTTSTTATRKKGWSKAAKGTVIGAAGGAIAGAVINKRNRAAGAVIGGIIGGGVGYGIGRSMDKKDGRY